MSGSSQRLSANANSVPTSAKENPRTPCKHHLQQQHHPPLLLVSPEDMSRPFYPPAPSFLPPAIYGYGFPQMPLVQTIQTTYHQMENKEENKDSEKSTETGMEQKTSGTFMLPGCTCKITKTTTYTFSYNCREQEPPDKDDKKNNEKKPKVVVDKKNIVYQQ